MHHATKVRRSWQVVGLCGVACASVVAILSFSRPNEPEYEGRHLTDWLEDLGNPSAGVRTNAVLAIRQMSTNAVPFLVRMLHAKDTKFQTKLKDVLMSQHWVQFHFRFDSQRQTDAYRGLGALGPMAKAAIPDLAKLLNDGFQVRQAAYTLYQIGPDAVPVLRQALSSTNEQARGEAAAWLGLSGAAGNPAVPDLIATLKDKDFVTRSKAATALTRFPDQAEVIVPPLIACLSDPDDTFRMNAARALAKFGEKGKLAIPELLKMVVSTNYQEGETATRVLMKLDAKQTLEALVRNLESPDARVRRATSWALTVCKSSGGPAVPALVKCLKDPDSEVRQDAAVALREIGQEPDLVVPALTENLKDPDLKVRSITAIALCRFGELAKPAVPRILELIQECEKDNDHFTAEGLFNALAKIDPEAAQRLNQQ